MHVHADAATIDLAGAQVDQAERPRRHSALFCALAQGLQGFDCVGNDHRRVFHPCLHDCLSPCHKDWGLFVTTMTNRDEQLCRRTPDADSVRRTACMSWAERISRRRHDFELESDRLLGDDSNSGIWSTLRRCGGAGTPERKRRKHSASRLPGVIFPTEAEA